MILDGVCAVMNGIRLRAIATAEDDMNGCVCVCVFVECVYLDRTLAGSIGWL